MIGYLLVRGGVHIVAYARALEHLTGADLGKLFPIPDISNKKFPEAKKLEDQGLHQIMFRWSTTDFQRLAEVWNGQHPEDGSELIVRDEIPDGAPPPNLDAEPQLTAPGVDMLLAQEAAKSLFRQ
jgi:Mn-containing catalase